MTTDIPRRGPEAIEALLEAMDLDELEEEAKQVIQSRKKTARPRAVRMLRIIRGLRENEMTPKRLMLKNVPVIPTKFRPVSVTGDTFIPGDANEMYRDLMEFRRLYNDTERELGRDGASEAYADLRKSVRATFGYDESPNPKTRARSVKGFMDSVTGSGPKASFLQSKVLSKPVDNVGRGVIIPDPDLDMDRIKIPEEQAWKTFPNFVQGRLVRGGMSPPAAFRHLRDRTPEARKALIAEMSERPVVLTRSPAWHSFNTVGVYADLTDGDAIRVNTYLTDGMNADFDGDTSNFHVPTTKEEIDDVKERLMVSKMIFSSKDPDKVMAVPKHEQVLGLNPVESTTGVKHKFKTSQEAMDQIKKGIINPNDDIEIETN